MTPALFRWSLFGVLLASVLALDLFSHRRGHTMSRQAALGWSAAWLTVGIGFSAVVFAMDRALGQQYLAAYAMEESLSLDNMFVFLLIFRMLGIPDEHQHTALAWGVFGALVFRALFILIGIELFERWDWIRYGFGALLVLAGIHAFRSSSLGEGQQSKLVEWLSRRLPVSADPRSNRFFTRENGRRVVTPLLVALVAIELSDIVFAVDSVPAALSVTHDRFVVYSSNAFAILGLRSLYLAGHGYLSRFQYLHYGLGAVLIFAAFKLIFSEHLPVPPLVSVAVIVACIAGAALASVLHRAEPAS
jgi:tellurite resistance protein TerC